MYVCPSELEKLFHIFTFIYSSKFLPANMKILDRVYTILVGLALLPDTAVTKPTMPPDIDEYLKTRSIYTPRPVTTPANLDYYPVLGGSNKRIADVLQYFPPCTIHVDWFYPAFASKDSNGNLKMSFYDFMNITILQGNDTLFASNIQLPNLPPAGPGISFAGPDSLVDITVDTPRIRGVKYPKLRAVPIHPEFRLQGAPVYSYVDRDHIRFFYGDRDNVHLTWNTDHNPDHNPDDPDQIKDYWRDEENRPYGCWYEKPLAGLEWGVNGSPQNIPSFKWHQPPPGITWIGGGVSITLLHERF